MSVVLHSRVWEIAIIKVKPFCYMFIVYIRFSRCILVSYVYFMSFRTNAIYPFIEMKIYGVGKAMLYTHTQSLEIHISKLRFSEILLILYHILGAYTMSYIIICVYRSSNKIYNQKRLLCCVYQCYMSLWSAWSQKWIYWPGWYTYFLLLHIIWWDNV